MDILGFEIGRDRAIQIFAAGILILFVVSEIVPYLVQLKPQTPGGNLPGGQAQDIAFGAGTVNLTVAGYEPTLFLPAGEKAQYDQLAPRLANARYIDYLVPGNGQYYVMSIAPGSARAIYRELKSGNVTVYGHLIIKFPAYIDFTYNNSDYIGSFPAGEFSIGGEVEPVYLENDTLVASIGVVTLNNVVVNLTSFRILPQSAYLLGNATAISVYYRTYDMNLSWENRNVNQSAIRRGIAALNLTNAANVTFDVKSYATYNGTPATAATIAAMGLGFVDYADAGTISVPVAFSDKAKLTGALGNITGDLQFPDSQVRVKLGDGTNSGDFARLAWFAKSIGTDDARVISVAMLNVTSLIDAEGRPYSFDEQLLLFELPGYASVNDTVNLKVNAQVTGSRVRGLNNFDLAK